MIRLKLDIVLNTGNTQKDMEELQNLIEALAANMTQKPYYFRPTVWPDYVFDPKDFGVGSEDMKLNIN